MIEYHDPRAKVGYKMEPYDLSIQLESSNPVILPRLLELERGKGRLGLHLLTNVEGEGVALE